jgi:hypothetical protein
MITIAILAGAVSVAGIVKAVQLVANDGYHRVPTRTYPNMFSIR